MPVHTVRTRTLAGVDTRFGLTLRVSGACGCCHRCVRLCLVCVCLWWYEELHSRPRLVKTRHCGHSRLCTVYWRGVCSIAQLCVVASEPRGTGARGSSSGSQGQAGPCCASCERPLGAGAPFYSRAGLCPLNVCRRCFEVGSMPPGTVTTEYLPCTAGDSAPGTLAWLTTGAVGVGVDLRG